MNQAERMRELLSIAAGGSAPLLRPRPSIPGVSGIAERWDCVRQIYGLTATRLAEPVRCVTEEGSRAPKPVTLARRAPKMWILLSSRRSSSLRFLIDRAYAAQGLSRRPGPRLRRSGAFYARPSRRRTC